MISADTQDDIFRAENITMLGGINQLKAPFLPFAWYLAIGFYIFSISIPICIFGILSNVVNIIVFCKMGLSTTSNISLFCLAISDLLTLCYVLIASVSNHPAFSFTDLNISMLDVARIGALVYYSVCALSGWITAVINVERSCCVAFPLKVKRIFTRTSVICLLGGMVLYQIASGLPRSFGVSLSWVTSPVTNRTLLTYVITKPRLLTLSFLISFSLPNVVCFVVVVLGTIFLISNFKRSRQFRGAMSSSGSEVSKMSSKDIRLVRSMIFISAIYIFGATPSVLSYIATTVYPALHIDDPYLGTLNAAFLATAVVVQGISCSVNIVVYFGMGSRFKQTFKDIFLSRYQRNSMGNKKEPPQIVTTYG